MDIPLGVLVPLLTAKDRYELVLFRRTQKDPSNDVNDAVDGTTKDIKPLFVIL